MTERPYVVTVNENRHEAETIVKKPYGVIILTGDGRKVTKPWHQIVTVCERLDPIDSDVDERVTA